MPFHEIPVDSVCMKVFADGALLVFRFKQQATIADYRQMTRVIHEHAAIVGKVNMVSIVTGKVGKIEDDARTAMNEFNQASRALLVGMAVLLDTGFGSLVVRTLINGINAFNRSDVPLKCFTNGGELISWLQALPNQHPSLKAIEPNALEQFMVPTSAPQ